MQTMNSGESQSLSPAIRVLVLGLCAVSMIGIVLSWVGVPVGFLYVVPLAIVFLILRKLSSQERARTKKKAPGRSARPGA
jgi:asparagine N-glycosylation enzyme membrane subunit Stt3